MAFEVPPGTLGQGRRWLALVPVVVAAGTVLAGVLGGALDSPAAPTVAPRGSGAAATAALVTAPVAAPVVPADVDCGEMAADDCRRAVRVAVGVLVGGDRSAVVSAVAAPSLICGDALDCPSDLLRGARAVGSVALTFGDGSVAWVNVVEPAPDGASGDASRPLVASVVRRFGAAQG